MRQGEPASDQDECSHTLREYREALAMIRDSLRRADDAMGRAREALAVVEQAMRDAATVEVDV